MIFREPFGVIEFGGLLWHDVQLAALLLDRPSRRARERRASLNRGITQTGKQGGSVTLPPRTFGGQGMPNRAVTTADTEAGYSPICRVRMTSVTNETGTTTVSYTPGHVLLGGKLSGVAKDGARYHAVAEESVTLREIAEVLGAGMEAARRVDHAGAGAGLLRIAGVARHAGPPGLRSSVPAAA